MQYVTAPTASGRYTLSDCTVVDVTDGSVTAHQDVRIEGERIASIGAHDPAARDDVRVAADGLYVAPGYSDAHCHPLNHPDEVDAAYALMLAAGITGYRQMSGNATVLRRRAEGTLRTPLGAPRLLALPGDLLTPLNASDPEAARAAVRKQKTQGADFIKAGFTTRTTLLAALAEATSVGLPLDGHLPEDIDPREASAAGMRCMEHLGTGRAFYAAASPHEDEALHSARSLPALPHVPGLDAVLGRLLDPVLLKVVVNPAARTSAETASTYRLLDESFDADRAEELATVLRDNGTWQCATLIRVHTQQLPGEHTGDERARFMDPRDRKEWDAATERFEQQPADVREALAAHWEAQRRMAGVLARVGVPMITGTDASGAGWVIPGFALHDEFALLTDAGVGPLELLQHATLDAARFFGRDDAGQIQPDFVADAVLLAGNPVEDASRLADVRGVISQGLYFSRPELDAIVERCAAVPAAR